jgi:hypothetical protein
MHVGPNGYQDQVNLYAYVGKDPANFSPGSNVVF